MCWKLFLRKSLESPSKKVCIFYNNKWTLACQRNSTIRRFEFVYGRGWCLHYYFSVILGSLASTKYPIKLKLKKLNIISHTQKKEQFFTFNRALENSNFLKLFPVLFKEIFLFNIHSPT